MLRTSNITRPRAVEDLLDSKLIAQIEPLDLTSRKIFAGKLLGERRSKKRGQSVEFADHRPYVVGDDLRRIDWNIFGRLDRLFLKLFLEEEDLALHLVLDASDSSDCGEPNKFIFMQRAAMALGYIGLVNLNRVSATVIGGAMTSTPAMSGSLATKSPGSAEADASEAPASFSLIHTLKDLRGRRRTHDLARFLCAIRPGGAPNFTEACKRIALARKGKGVMLIFSDYLLKEGYETGLKMLVGKGYDLILVQVLSPQEIDPAGPGGITGDLRLKDVEDADLTEITISAPLLKRYRANLAAYCNQLCEFAARREIAVMTMPSDTPIDKLILESLRKRGVLQ
ncbi:MAG: DUF58 domain-containing protein [Phycisphaerales bacterium]|nr:DUF58 domain-containing protein [Phycisphaerales bacterium]